MTHEELQALLDTHDDGILRAGSHSEGREFCALEFESKVRGRAWSDAPVTLPDLRPINDGRWSSDAARTRALLPVMVALWDWSSWSYARRQAWAQRVAIQTVVQIISELPSLSDDVRAQRRRRGRRRRRRRGRMTCSTSPAASGFRPLRTRLTYHKPMTDVFALIALSTAYVFAVVGGLWWIARLMTGREPVPHEEDFAIGDRVQQRSAWRGEPVKHGTVTEAYQAAPSQISNGPALYAVLWDGGHTPQYGYMHVGLEREHA